MNNDELTHHTIELNDIKISNRLPLTLISGPCQLESLEHSMMIAEKLIEICADNAINLSSNRLLTKLTAHLISQSVALELKKGLKYFKNSRRV